jgi:hypothetical protein
MLRTSLPLRSCTLVLALAASAAAQAVQPVPAHADQADGHHSVGLPFGAPGFRTQFLVAAGAIAPTGAALTGLRFRADRTSLPLAGGSVPNVTVALSQTTNFVGNMNAQFALNVTGPQTTVFTGTVALPAHSDGFAGPAAWDIVIPFASTYTVLGAQGSLLIDIVGNNAPGGFPSYWLDAMQGGGAATSFGRSGDDPSFDNLRLIAATGNSLSPRLLSPGHGIDYISNLTFTSPPGVLVLGLVGFSVPLDLGLVGAPTNSLYLSPLVLATHSWQQSFIGWYSTTTLAVPNDPLLFGTLVYAQSATFVPAANPLGLITSNAIETRIGDQYEQFPMQQLDASDAAAPTGVFVDFGFSQPDFGAAAILLEGVFF